MEGEQERAYGTDLVASASFYSMLRRIKEGIEPEGDRVEKMVEANILERGFDGLEIDYEGLQERWFDMWHDEIGEKPRIPTHFSEFFQGYIDSYLEFEERSNFHRMLKADFLHGMVHCDHRNELPPSLEELKEQLEEGYSKHHYVPDHIIRGMRNAKYEGD